MQVFQALKEEFHAIDSNSLWLGEPGINAEDGIELVSSSSIQKRWIVMQSEAL